MMNDMFVEMMIHNANLKPVKTPSSTTINIFITVSLISLLLMAIMCIFIVWKMLKNLDANEEGPCTELLPRGQADDDNDDTDGGGCEMVVRVEFADNECYV